MREKKASLTRRILTGLFILAFMLLSTSGSLADWVMHEENGIIYETEYFASYGPAVIVGYSGSDGILVVPADTDVMYLQDDFITSDLKTISLKNIKQRINISFYADCPLLEKFIAPDDPSSWYVVEDGVLFSKSHYDDFGTIYWLYEWTDDKLVKYPSARKGEYTVPDWVQDIDSHAFSGSKVTSVFIPDSVTHISLWAFKDCALLEKVRLSETLTYITDHVFENCTSLKEIEIPESVTSIGQRTFANCSSLKKIRIPATVTSIDDTAFSGTDCVLDVSRGSVAHQYAVDHKLSYTLDGEEPTGDDLVEKDGLTFFIRADGNATVVGYTGQGNIVIPEQVNGHTVDRLKEELFYGSSGITSVTIPATVTGFGSDPDDNRWDYVFSYSYDLTAIHVDDNNPVFRSVDGVLYNRSMTDLICYPSCRPGSSYHVPAGTTYLCCTSFADASNLRHLYLDSKNAEWMGYTFYGDSDLTVHYIAGGNSESRVGINSRYCKAFVPYNPDEPHTHQEIVTEEAAAATCTEAGHTAGKYCAECDEVLEGLELIPATGHTIISVAAKEATCLEEGNTAHWACSVCGKLFSDAEGSVEIVAEAITIPIKNHTLVHYAEKESTCEQAGNWEYWECSVCHKKFTGENAIWEVDEEDLVIEARKHLWSYSYSPKVEATEFKDGHEEYWKCNDCGKLFSDVERQHEIDAPIVIPATGHDLTAHARVDATCTETGTEAYWECAGCGGLFSDSEGAGQIYSPVAIPAKGHQLTVHSRIEATAEETGTEAYWQCEACGKLFADRNATAEIEEPVVISVMDMIPGDVDGNGDVDGLDIIRLMKYLAEEIDPDTRKIYEINENNADVNGDGVVDEKDLLRLVRYFGGEKVTLEFGKVTAK